jgi:hypothetical protein
MHGRIDVRRHLSNLITQKIQVSLGFRRRLHAANLTSCFSTLHFRIYAAFVVKTKINFELVHSRHVTRLTHPDATLCNNAPTTNDVTRKLRQQKSNFLKLFFIAQAPTEASNILVQSAPPKFTAVSPRAAQQTRSVHRVRGCAANRRALAQGTNARPRKHLRGARACACPRYLRLLWCRDHEHRRTSLASFA